MNKRMDMQGETNYYMRYYRPGYARGLESGLSMTSIGDKDQ